MRRLFSLLGILVAGVLHARADAVLQWNGLMIDAIRVDTTGPTLSSRNLAMLHCAIHDSVQSIVRTHQPYRFQLDPGGEADPAAAAAAAGHEIMRVLYPGFGGRSDALYAGQLDALGDTPAVTRGVALGHEIAMEILADRVADGSQTEVPYIPSNLPGQWRRTYPTFRPPLTPHWRYVDPFCIESLDPFMPPPPPALDSPEYAEAVNELKAIGGTQSTVRTAEQSETAVFWSDFSYTSMPPGHWHLIAQGIAETQGNTLVENARLFALLSVAQADGAILCWEVKFRYNLWRPITAIQRANEDGNPLTEADPTWIHYLNSPPFPAYTSGHSTFSKASSQVLTHYYGTDALTFTATSDSIPGLVRSYTSLAGCADEVGMSRIYGGIHFPFDNVEGKRTGGKIGDYVFANFLLPNQSLPRVQVIHPGTADASVRVHGAIGRTVELQCSGDLVTWEVMASAPARPGGVVLGDSGALGATQRFYRIRQY